MGAISSLRNPRTQGADCKMITAELSKAILNDKDCFSDVIGQDAAKYGVKSTILANRHLLIIGPAGVGKTTLAKNIAKILPPLKGIEGCAYRCTSEKPVCSTCKKNKNMKTRTIPGNERFIRIQGSPDLTVEDLIGDIDPIKALQFGPLSLEAFTPGKIFQANNGILFFDELNRCPEKLQNALLQVLQEGKATIGSYNVDIEADFLFIATMNPDDSNTEKLSTVLLDRFDVVVMSYPETLSLEKEILKHYGKKILQISEDLNDLIISFIRVLRESKDIERKPSVRATLGLYERSQTNALLKKKKKAELEDMHDAVFSVLAHRITLKPALRYVQSPEEFLQKEFQNMMKTGMGREFREKKGDVP